MPLLLPPETEKLLPFLKSYLTKNYNLSFSEDLKPFSLPTEILFSYEKEKVYGLLLLERLLLENFEKNLLSYELLKILSSLETIPGYIFHFKGKPPSKGCFFKLAHNLYFYPLFFGNSSELFLELWRKKRFFKALYFEISQENLDFKKIKKELRLLKSLGFTRLTRKAKKDLKEIFELHQKGDILKWYKRLSKKGALLLVSQNPLLSDLSPQLNPLLCQEGRVNYYLFSKDLYEDLLRILKDLDNFSGIVKAGFLKEKPFKGINVFLLGYASLEHAKRAGTRVHVLDGFTLHVLADLFYEWEDLGASLKFYQLAKPYTLQPIELALSEASIYYALEDFKEAKKILKGKLCGCLKEDPRLHYNLGIIYLEEGDRENAEYHLYKAYLLNEREALFRRALLQFLWEEERLEEMEEILNKVSEPTLEDKVFLGKLYFLKGDYKRALSYLQEILSSPKRDGFSLYFLSWLYLYFKKDKEASRIFLEESKRLLSPEDFHQLLERFGLPE